MENKIASQLNVFYYGMMILTIVIVTLMLFGVSRGIIVPVDKMSSLGKTIQYIVIFDALITIPVGLWWFKRKCSLIAKMNDDDAKWCMYKKCAAIRILLVGNSMPIGILAFYALGCYMSMCWIAAIGAIAWYFTKPTPKKIYLELHPQEEQY